MIDLHKLDKFRLKDREREFYGCTGDSGNGVFKVYVGGKSFRVIASNGMGWEHVSVSPGSAQRKCCPTWDEMCAIKDMFSARTSALCSSTRLSRSTSTTIRTACIYGNR